MVDHPGNPKRDVATAEESVQLFTLGQTLSILPICLPLICPQSEIIYPQDGYYIYRNLISVVILRENKVSSKRAFMTFIWLITPLVSSWFETNKDKFLKYILQGKKILYYFCLYMIEQGNHISHLVKLKN